ncbi:MAG: hypothetical protein H6636_00745 [Anaerolineales bacterium]|nr:hypothetical protein [Anaerolineales bacterium]
MNLSSSEAIQWLFASEYPWVVYNALLDFKSADPTSDEVQAAYRDMQQHPLIGTLLAELEIWPPEKPLGKAYDPKDSLWKLSTLADLGLGREDDRIAAIAERVFAAQAENGGFLHGGFDHTKSWHTRPYICISHVMTYALTRFGYLDDPRLQKAYEHIQAWARQDGGWHPNERNLPGNDREAEPSCPFGTVNILRALAVHPTLRESKLAQNAANFLLMCWTRREEPFRPVGFGIGKTWDKLQYPFIQYQLLKVADTLSQIPSACRDHRYLEIVDHLQSRQSADGKWTPEGINKPYSDFDFGQKNHPSAWLTFLVLRIIKRSQR